MIINKKDKNLNKIQYVNSWLTSVLSGLEGIKL